MCLAKGPQRSDAGEARTRGPSVSSQALYHCATALPPLICTAMMWKNRDVDEVCLGLIHVITYESYL